MKKTKLFLSTLVLMVAMGITALGAEWKQDTTGWWYQNDDGGYTTNGWQTIGGKQYYFGADGYMFANTTTPDGKQVGPDGVLVDAPLFVFDTTDWSAVYTGYELTTDYKGNPCILVSYDFTNKSNERQGVHTSWMDIEAFQNGEECDDYVILENTNHEGMKNAQKAIDPGATIKATNAFSISDRSPVTFSIRHSRGSFGTSQNTDAVVTATLNLE